MRLLEHRFKGLLILVLQTDHKVVYGLRIVNKEIFEADCNVVANMPTCCTTTGQHSLPASTGQKLLEAWPEILGYRNSRRHRKYMSIILRSVAIASDHQLAIQLLVVFLCNGTTDRPTD